MKSSKLVGVWRPVMGVAIVGALALGVNALAGPRGTDQAVRGTDKSGTEVTRLVTGDPAQINAVTAAYPPNALVLAVTPVNPPSATGLTYPAGVTINGQELTVNRNTKAGFRAWFHVQISNWDPTHTGSGDPAAPRMAAYQVKIDCTGYYASDCKDVDQTPGDGLDLLPAVQACGGNADCRSGPNSFGEAWVKCVGGFCENGYLDSSNATTNVPEPEGVGKGWCANDGCAGFGVGVGTCNYLYFGVSDNVLGHLDEGGLYYGGTLVLDLPAEAKGKYTVVLNLDETFAASPGTPPVDIPPVAENGFVINYITGSCCYGLGTPLAGCADGSPLGGGQCLNQSDCAAMAQPSVFSENSLCFNPPTADQCSECTGNIEGVDLTCNDNDACTTETCVQVGDPPVGICNRGNIAGYTAGICCDPANGNLAAAADTNPCTDDACSLDPVSGTPKPGNGVPVHTPASSQTTCNDLNPCTFGDHCNGVTTGCAGTLVTGEPCSGDSCLHNGETPPGICTNGACTCSPKPKVTYVIDGNPKTCIGGTRDGLGCAKDTDCSGGGVCDLFPANCFFEDDKITAVVHIGAAGSPINGGQFLLQYDPSCVSFNGVICLPPYTNTVYGPILNTGTVFIACGVPADGGFDGPLGNTDMLLVSYTMIGQCNNCFLSFGDDGVPGGPPGPNNPLNTYLVDDGGYKVGIEGQPKEIAEFGELVLTVPHSVTVNSDCDMPAKDVTWAQPTATFSCGDRSLECRGAHESGLVLTQQVVWNGGLLPQGANSFCCFTAAEDKCAQTAGCQGDTNNCLGIPPVGCWTVEVTDQTTLDIHIQLEPPMLDPELERCIEFCLYGNCAELPYCFEENVVFGGLYNYIGKANGDIKIPKGKYGCITAQDQLHSLRSCTDPICNPDGVLYAEFKGDPTYGGNWLIMGNLDAWKKGNPLEDPSLDVIDILDFGKFVASYMACYEDRVYGCHEGPHADIDGDGCVTMADYGFVLRNFMVSAKDCCCGPTAADLPPALSEVSVTEYPDMAVADLNGDGVVNGADMDAFTQGARPVKANDRKGGKGLRSGR